MRVANGDLHALNSNIDLWGNLIQNAMPILELVEKATPENFDEADYLRANPDVEAVVRSGGLESGRMHFDMHGSKEGRLLRREVDLTGLRAEKAKRFVRALNLDMPHRIDDEGRYDFLTDELRRETGVSSTSNVSENGYDEYCLGVINKHDSGLVVDVGSGKRPSYFPNVVNYEIVNYDTTDVLGVGEALPFKDGSVDAVISIAVLEHVRDPFKCASEIVRILKPGGDLVCAVPFLQPLHGYPHHYYNMSHQGLRALFERGLEIDDQLVIDSIRPIWTLAWFVSSWAGGLEGQAKEEFLDLPLRQFLASPLELLDKPWVRALSTEKNFELASATLLLAHKPL